MRRLIPIAMAVDTAETDEGVARRLFVCEGSVGPVADLRGSTNAHGAITFTSSVKSAARARDLRLEVEASDQLGNHATLKQTIALKR